jgi:hypothetical protein
MNHYVTLGIVAIVDAMTLTAVGFAIPQQALAYRHHNNHNNSIKVDQQVNQLNACTTPPPPPMSNDNKISSVMDGSSSTVCINSGDNSADIHR